MFKPGYIGSKAGVFRRIIGEMPPHSVYVEPFFGSGAIFFKKRPAARSILIDPPMARAAARDFFSRQTPSPPNVLALARSGSGASRRNQRRQTPRKTRLRRGRKEGARGRKPKTSQAPLYILTFPNSLKSKNMVHQFTGVRF